MISRGQRVFLLYIYAYGAWLFFIAAGQAALAAVWTTLQLDPQGAPLIPVAGFLTWVGLTLLDSYRGVLGTPGT